MNHRSTIAWGATALVALALTLPAAAQEAGTKLQIAEKEPFGQYLADAEGRSLYILEEDTRGGDGAEAASKCYEECVEEWPPLAATAAPEAGEQIDPAMLSTIERTDGSQQVTYNGWPLYHYHDDQAPGDTEGQGVHDDWGGWYLIAPSGEPIEDDE